MVTNSYFDTSALVKHYQSETGSEKVNAIIANADNKIYISELSIVEFTSAFKLLRKIGKLDETAFRVGLAQFAADIGEKFVIVGFKSGWVELAKDLVLEYDLRTLDALQLAAALGLKPLAFTFVCADKKLLKAAASADLETLNPSQ